MDCGPAQPDHRARNSEPILAELLWPRVGDHAGRFWDARRGSVSSGVARLACLRTNGTDCEAPISRFKTPSSPVEFETHASIDGDFIDVSAGLESHTGTLCEGSV